MIDHVTIREIADLFDGPHATPAPADSGPVFLGIKNITEDGRLTFEEVRHISEEEFPRWVKRVLPSPGDVVFTYEATLHRYAVIPEGFLGCLGRRTALLRVRQDRVDARWLLYYFRSPTWRRVIDERTIVGTTVDRIPIEKFPSFPVALPPLDVQRRIAATLASYDELIDVNERRVRLLEESIRVLYREWFERLRFPGHQRVAVKDGVPEGWEQCRLDEAALLNPKTRVPPDRPRPFVPMKALSSSTMLVEDWEERVGAGGAKFRNGDTLLARITPCLENGKTAFVQFLEDEEATAAGSTEFIVLRERRLGRHALYCLARCAPFRDHAIRSMVGSDGRQRVQPDALASFAVLVPDDATGAAFEALAAPTFRQIHTLNLQSRAAARARDALLPRLMDGTLTPPEVALVEAIG